MDRYEEAVEHYTELLEFEPHRVDALARLQDLLLRLRQYERLMVILDEQAAQAREPEERNQLVARMAMLADQELGDPRRAINLWKRVLKTTSKDPR